MNRRALREALEPGCKWRDVGYFSSGRGFALAISSGKLPIRSGTIRRRD